MNEYCFFFQKKCYYFLYLWLNLPEKYRRDTLSKESNFPTDSVPPIQAMVKIVALELSKVENGLKMFAINVLKEDPVTVRNLILCPIPWNLMSKSLR